jgi:Na+/H+ antiporter NhaD/arsenite permease-like protein
MTGFIKKEPVLSAAFVLAIITCFLHVPQADVLQSIDFRVLAILFCLMTVTSGLDEEGILSAAASVLLSKTEKWRQVYIVLVFLCFFSSMIVTNDVSLITFVPVAIKTTYMAGQEKRLIKVIIMQTIAANLGSMLTPIGNPQNLYLYSLSGLTAAEFMLKILPVWCGAFILILLTAFTEKNEYIGKREHMVLKKFKKDRVILYFVLFAISLLCVMRVIHYSVAFAIVAVSVFVKNKKLFIKTDYTLIITFIFFFIFIYNIKSTESVRSFFESTIKNNEFVWGLALSQIISNVPAAVLLSGFTKNYIPLMAGVNIGGLGTLIASMASLISYKLYLATKNADIKAFMISFTLWNVVSIMFLLPFSVLYV